MVAYKIAAVQGLEDTARAWGVERATTMQRGNESVARDLLGICRSEILWPQAWQKNLVAVAAAAVAFAFVDAATAATAATDIGVVVFVVFDIVTAVRASGGGFQPEETVQLLEENDQPREKDRWPVVWQRRKERRVWRESEQQPVENMLHT